MTREERRAAYPELAAFVDDIREQFDGAEVTYAAIPDYEWGERCPEGVRPVIERMV